MPTGRYVRKNNNIIEINGKRYDANTGSLLDAPAASESNPKPTKPHSIDGVHRPARTVARSAAHHPESSKTLMRHAVKKPKATNKSNKAVTAKRTTAEIVISKSVKQLDPKRLQHAKQVHQSKLISRFGATVPTNPQMNTYDQLAVSKVNHARKNAAASHHQPHHKTQTTAELLEKALQNATSHEQPAIKNPKLNRAKRGVGIGAAIVLAVTTLGLVTAQNLPNARLQMASAKAGFDASLPTYKPAGYSLGKLNYSEGVVATQFKSNSNDDRGYTITQKKTSWDSAALRDVFVKTTDANYEVIESAGRTIYIYGKHNATWVNSGVWYQIQSNGSLSNRQLVDLASSL